MTIKQILLILSLLFINTSQAWVSVGSSPGFGVCDYANIQDAIDSNESEIRLLNNLDFSENTVIDHSLDIRGGFASCFAADLNITNGTNTIIKGDVIMGAAVIAITTNTMPTIRLSYLTLRDAVNQNVPNGGHGLYIGNSNGLIELNNSLIINNEGEDGAGIYIGNPSGDLTLVISNSSVFGNTASKRGGGIFCGNANTIVRVSDGSLIGENSAEDGGGIAAVNGCSVTVDSGTDLSNGQLRGIIGNGASRYGGGVFLDLGASLQLQGNKYALNILGNNTDPVTLANNSAQSHGGGIYAVNSSQIEVIDGYIYNNTTSTGSGAGVYLGSSSTTAVSFMMQSSNKRCWNDGKCSILASNRALGNNGGAIFVTNGAQSTILNSHIFNNRANFGSAVYLFENNGLNSIAKLDGNYIYNNGSNGANSTLDNFVIRANGDVTLDVLHNTIVDNDMEDSRAIIGITGGVDMTLKNSIIHNGDEDVLEIGIGTNITNVECLVVNDNATINFGPRIESLTINFVDSNTNDYHLTGNSEAIDYCADEGSITLDTDLENRGWDDTGFFDAGGPFDAGADETYANDIIFSNNFD